MDLVSAILKGIADERPIDGHIAIPSPLRDMIEHYNKLAMHDDNLHVITSLTSGAELKMHISRMDPEQQVALLHMYSVATQSLDTPMLYAEDPAKVAERRLRHYLIKGSFNTFITLSLIMVGMVAMHAYKTNALPDNSVIKSLMSGIVDVIKLILQK